METFIRKITPVASEDSEKRPKNKNTRTLPHFWPIKIPIEGKISVIFQPKLRVIEIYNTVNSDLNRKIQVCSFREGPVEVTRRLKTNSTSATFPNRDSNSDVKDEFYHFWTRVVCLKRKTID